MKHELNFNEDFNSCKIKKQLFKDSCELTFYNFPMWIPLSKAQKAKKVPTVGVDKDGKKIVTGYTVTNSKKVGKPKYEKINFQKLYSGTWNYHTRAKIIEDLSKIFSYKLKEAFKDYPKYKFQVKDGEKVNLHIEYHNIINQANVRLVGDTYKYNIYDGNDVKSTRWDLTNATVLWLKIIEDCLVKEGILSDDNVNIITSHTITYVQVDRLDERKMVITLIK